MAKSLKVLQRVKKMELDELRRSLLGKLTRQDQLYKELHELNADYEREKEFAAQHPLLCDFGAYTENYLKKRKVLETSIAELEQQIEQLRNVMADVFKEEKTYNIIDEERTRQQRKEMEMNEQKLLDEVGTNAYIKKHKK
ncbi:MAG: flagellar FliJ family protein [Alphaproteobacteria bacterium]|nr:flagellar FliJ family protein [Alphaproteobacteria bacterium]